MHHVPRRCRATTVLYTGFPPPPILRCHYTTLLSLPTAGSPKATFTYVCGTNILGRTACEHASAKLVQFDSIPPLVFSFSAASRFFFLVSLSPDLHDPVSPRRTIDPRLTLLGAVSLNSIYGFSLFFFFSVFCFFFLFTREGIDHRVDLSLII